MSSKEPTSQAAGLAFVGSIVAGIGIGWIVKPDYIVQGAIIGIGVGFMLMALLKNR